MKSNIECLRESLGNERNKILRIKKIDIYIKTKKKEITLVEGVKKFGH